MKTFITKQIVLCLAALVTFACGQGSNSNPKLSRNDAPSNSTPANNALFKANEQRVTFNSPDGVILVGSFYDSATPNSPAVLLLHQFGSSRQSYDDFAKRLQTKGFGVLAIDGRGFGESVKTTDGKTVPVSRSDEAVKGMNADVATAFDFLSKQKNVDASRIGIVGASYGSSLAIIYGAENTKVKAVALLSPGLNYFGNMPTEPAVKKYGDRSLLMVAADDDPESADSVKKLMATGASDKYEIKIYPKGGHGTGLFNAKVGLEDLLEQFLTKNL